MSQMLSAGVSVVHTGYRQTGPTPLTERFNQTYREEALDAACSNRLIRFAPVYSWAGSSTESIPLVLRRDGAALNSSL